MNLNIFLDHTRWKTKSRHCLSMCIQRNTLYNHKEHHQHHWLDTVVWNNFLFVVVFVFCCCVLALKHSIIFDCIWRFSFSFAFLFAYIMNTHIVYTNTIKFFPNNHHKSSSEFELISANFVSLSRLFYLSICCAQSLLLIDRYSH